MPDAPAARGRRWALAACAAAAGASQGLGGCFLASGAPAAPRSALRPRGLRGPPRARAARAAWSPGQSADAAAVAAAADAAAAAAPLILAVVGVAAAGSAAQLSRAFGGAAGGPEPAQGEQGFFGPSRWLGRTAAVAATWALLIAYAFTQAPGRDPEASVADQALVMQVINTPFEASQVPPLFAGIFNSLGIWPLLYAAVLLPGAAGQSIPAAPFCAGSFFLGAFALSPYLALREYRGKPGEVTASQLDWPTRNVLESRWNAVLALAGTAYLALYALGNGTIGAVAPEAAWAGFLPLFTQSLTAHVSSVDFMVLWMFFPPVLLEDGRRRGRFAGPPGEWASAEKALFAFCAAVPVVGGGVWLLLRPELAQGGEE